MALEEPSENDEQIIQNDVRVYLDRRVAEWFSGAQLGYETDEWGGGFTFNHPDIGQC